MCKQQVCLFSYFKQIEYFNQITPRVFFICLWKHTEVRVKPFEDRNSFLNFPFIFLKGNNYVNNCVWALLVSKNTFNMVWRSLGIKKCIGAWSWESSSSGLWGTKPQRSPWQWHCVSWIQALLMRLHLPGTESPAQPVPWSFLTKANSSCRSWLLWILSVTPD